MSQASPISPLEIGERVFISSEEVILSGIVRSTAPWIFILIETDNGDLYLEVDFNISAVSWSRIVLLEPWVKVEDGDLHAQLARQIAYSPRRTDVDEINGALRLCDRLTQMRRSPS
jgi:hypothetical protein